MSEGFQKFIETYEPYLNDIWRRVYYTAIFFAIAFCVGFFSSGWIIEKFISSFHLNNVTIAVMSPFQLLDLGVDIGMFIATILTIPIVLWHLYTFLRPAVSKEEWKALRAIFGLIPLSLFLFISGFAYGFFSLYWGLQALAELHVGMGLKNIWDIALFWSQLISTATLLGIIFQFPIVLKLLINFGIVKRQFLIEKRRVAYAIIIIGVSILPPTDGVSLIIMSAPLWIMYELTILLSRPVKNRRSRAGEDEHYLSEKIMVK
jgi:sec-independent protein translocase protein TatC